MKKTLRKIAFVLLVIMFACVITGCLELLKLAVDVGSEVGNEVTRAKTEKLLYQQAMKSDEEDTF